MRVRDTYLLKEETISDSQTKIIDIEIVDPITALEILYEADNGATSNLDHEIHDDVSKIEVVDGGTVLASLSMIEWQALNFFELGKFPYISLTEKGGATQKEGILILFGRYYGDPEWAFDPTKYKNPQLKCTHALTISSTAGFTAGTGKLTVIAHILEDGVKPKGFLSAKNIKSWTTAASGEERTELPNDYPIRLLLVKALLTTNRADEVISRIKVSVDSDKYVPFELDTDHLAQRNAAIFGLVRQKKQLLASDGDARKLDIYDIQGAYVQSLQDMDIANVEATDAEQVTLQVLILTTTPSIAKDTTDRDILCEVAGWQPHATVCYPFGRMNVAEEWLPAQNYKKIEVIATQAAANGAASVFIQQARTY